MSNSSDYPRNVDKGMKSTVKMTGVRKWKLTSKIGEKKLQEGNRKLRESVLNKLWDSLPPETQSLSHSEDEDSDSTQSGLDEGEIEYEEGSPSPEFRNKQIRNEIKVNRRSAPNSQAKHSCPQKRIEDPEISWDTNLDFIQSIIWLKSTTEKLQRVPADEFFKAFQNQWESSPTIKSTNNHPVEGRSSSSFATETKQREKIDLIRNRLAINDGNFGRNREDIVIPETDESETPSLQSSQCVPNTSAIINITAVSEPIENSTIDSGFGSERPAESVEASNSESGTKDQAKLFGTRNEESIIGENWRGKKFLKRKRDAVCGGASEVRVSKRPRLSVSSATLNHVLRSSECNKVLVTSVKVILKFLESEENGCYSLGNNRYGSVHNKEAIEAVVGIVDQLEKEKGSNSCKNEAVVMIKRVLGKMLKSGEVDKLSAWEHHRLMILDLCRASSICTEIINYLISEVKKLIPIPIQTTENNMRESMVIMDKSCILFHSLEVALRKYRSFARTSATAGEPNASRKIPEVTDLWKRHWKVVETEPDIFVTALEKLEIPEDPEEQWTRVLEELVVVSTTVWPLVKIFASQCLAMLKSPVSS